MYRAMIDVAMQGMPTIVALSAFYFHEKLSGNDLRPQEAFAALVLFNLLRQPLAMLPIVITYVCVCVCVCMCVCVCDDFIFFFFSLSLSLCFIFFYFDYHSLFLTTTQIDAAFLKNVNNRKNKQITKSRNFVRLLFTSFSLSLCTL